MLLKKIKYNLKKVGLKGNTFMKSLLLQVKCHTYWPEGTLPSNMLTFDDVQLTVELIEEDHQQNYVLRTLR